MDLAALAATPLLSALVLAGLVAFDALFPAVPSDAFVVSAGALAAAENLGLGWVVLAVVTGAMTGDHVVYCRLGMRFPVYWSALTLEGVCGPMSTAPTAGSRVSTP
jgi:membrane protein DedA with SNARE-associated domain